jgi:multiple antibiotic resistance protein
MASYFDLNEFLTISFTLFAIIDIVGAIPVLVSLKSKIGEIEAGKATLWSGFLMLLFLFLGGKLLSLLGVDVSSFAVAGSIVIFIMGLEMILGIELFRSDPESRAGSIVPVAFPLIAGSGTLTTIMSLKANFSSYNIFAGIIVNLIAVFLVLKSIGFIESKIGKNGLFVIRKFFGVILLAISVKLFKANIFL